MNIDSALKFWRPEIRVSEHLPTAFCGAGDRTQGLYMLGNCGTIDPHPQLQSYFVLKILVKMNNNLRSFKVFILLSC